MRCRKQKRKCHYRRSVPSALPYSKQARRRAAEQQHSSSLDCWQAGLSARNEKRQRNRSLTSIVRMLVVVIDSQYSELPRQAPNHQPGVRLASPPGRRQASKQRAHTFHPGKSSVAVVILFDVDVIAASSYLTIGVGRLVSRVCFASGFSVSRGSPMHDARFESTLSEAHCCSVTCRIKR